MPTPIRWSARTRRCPPLTAASASRPTSPLTRKATPISATATSIRASPRSTRTVTGSSNGVPRAPSPASSIRYIPSPPPNQVLYSADSHPGRIYKLSLDGKVLGVLGESGKQPKQFGWVHEIACPSENVLFVAEILNWRIQKLILEPVH